MAKPYKGPKEVKGSCHCNKIGIGFLKIIFCPCILFGQALWRYLFACVGVYLQRIGRTLACGICVCCKWTYKDKKFPAGPEAIGAWGGRTPAQVDAEIDWHRIKDILSKTEEGADRIGGGGDDGAKLFNGKINPSAICQGQVGDCWLMSALACLCKADGAIQRAFITREYNEYGRYRIRLFDKPKNKFKTVVVDDWIPCKKGTKTPVFAQPSGGDAGAWVLILEKAMAKFMGSYHALDGGSTLWAFETLTGNYCFKLKQGVTSYRRFDLVHPANGDKGVAMLQASKDELTGKEVFAALRFYVKKKSVVAASSGAGADTENINGIVQGHAYSITRVKEVDSIQLVEVRNPWGQFEWTGAWSDNSEKWKEHPKVAEVLKFKPSDDGSFWMEFSDFVTYFKNLDFCFRTTGWDDLTIDIHEEHPVCGPTLGCLEGCGTFWCCCAGLNALACNNQKQEFMKAPKGCCSFEVQAELHALELLTHLLEDLKVALASCHAVGASRSSVEKAPMLKRMDGARTALLAGAEEFGRHVEAGQDVVAAITSFACISNVANRRTTSPRALGPAPSQRAVAVAKLAAAEQAAPAPPPAPAAAAGTGPTQRQTALANLRRAVAATQHIPAPASPPRPSATGPTQRQTALANLLRASTTSQEPAPAPGPASPDASAGPTQRQVAMANLQKQLSFGDTPHAAPGPAPSEPWSAHRLGITTVCTSECRGAGTPEVAAWADAAVQPGAPASSVDAHGQAACFLPLPPAHLTMAGGAVHESATRASSGHSAQAAPEQLPWHVHGLPDRDSGANASSGGVSSDHAQAEEQPWHVHGLPDRDLTASASSHGAGSDHAQAEEQPWHVRGPPARESAAGPEQRPWHVHGRPARDSDAPASSGGAGNDRAEAEAEEQTWHVHRLPERESAATASSSGTGSHHAQTGPEEQPWHVHAPPAAHYKPAAALSAPRPRYQAFARANAYTHTLDGSCLCNLEESATSGYEGGDVCGGDSKRARIMAKSWDETEAEAGSSRAESAESRVDAGRASTANRVTSSTASCAGVAGLLASLDQQWGSHEADSGVTAGPAAGAAAARSDARRSLRMSAALPVCTDALRMPKQVQPQGKAAAAPPPGPLHALPPAAQHGHHPSVAALQLRHARCSTPCKPAPPDAATGAARREGGCDTALAPDDQRVRASTEQQLLLGSHDGLPVNAAAPHRQPPRVPRYGENHHQPQQPQQAACQPQQQAPSQVQALLPIAHTHAALTPPRKVAAPATHEAPVPAPTQGATSPAMHRKLPAQDTATVPQPQDPHIAGSVGAQGLRAPDETASQPGGKHAAAAHKPHAPPRKAAAARATVEYQQSPVRSGARALFPRLWGRLTRVKAVVGTALSVALVTMGVVLGAAALNDGLDKIDAVEARGRRRGGGGRAGGSGRARGGAALTFVASISVENAIVFVTGGDGCGHANDVFSGCFADDAEEALRRAADAAAGVSMPVRLATNIVRFMHDNTGNWDGPAGGGVVSASFINAKPAVGGIGVEPRGGGVLRVLFTVASGAVADTVVRWRWKLRQARVAVFDVLSDHEEARHRALWPAFLAAKAAGKRAQFHRARLVVDGERVAAPVC
ncbi:hypothetical protein FOA52_014975 [Chlamydomonas sp. UWO 241]|nr:hypothetical protein FOA52_014975 [Chlamydomonas sp. UWO 241]